MNDDEYIYLAELPTLEVSHLYAIFDNALTVARAVNDEKHITIFAQNAEKLRAELDKRKGAQETKQCIKNLS